MSKTTPHDSAVVGWKGTGSINKTNIWLYRHGYINRIHGSRDLIFVLT